MNEVLFFCSSDVESSAKMPPEYGLSECLTQPKQRQVTVWVTASTYPGTVNTHCGQCLSTLQLHISIWLQDGKNSRLTALAKDRALSLAGGRPTKKAESKAEVKLVVLGYLVGYLAGSVVLSGTPHPCDVYI